MASAKSNVGLNLGWTSAEQFWKEVMLPDYEEFNNQQTARSAVHAVLSASHLYYWILAEQPSGTKDNFKKRLGKCPALGWIKEYANTAKHRRDRTSSTIQNVEQASQVKAQIPIGGGASIVFRGISPLTVDLNDGTSRDLSGVLKDVIDYWRNNYFQPTS